MEEKKNKGSKMMLVLVILMVLLIGLVVGVFAFFFMNMGDDESGSQIVAAITPTQVADLEFFRISHPINTNLLTGPDGARRVSFNFEIGIDGNHPNSSTIMDTLGRAESVVRTIAINVLGEMTAEQILDIGGRAFLTQAILDRLRTEFQTNLIVDIFIIDIMVQ
ncbi:MAG: flagellar basal body-associated FliL family protein [Defluviitaleaceae bacterium]|nr:flagellar basal body-associated FliL family protein [Defluviitaleaceae bacterium]